MIRERYVCRPGHRPVPLPPRIRIACRHDARNIECKVIDIVDRLNIVVLEALAAYVDEERKERRVLHAVGNGTFIVDGRKQDRRKMMASKLPPGV